MNVEVMSMTEMSVFMGKDHTPLMTIQRGKQRVTDYDPATGTWHCEGDWLTRQNNLDPVNITKHFAILKDAMDITAHSRCDQPKNEGGGYPKNRRCPMVAAVERPTPAKCVGNKWDL
jgi:hypothetical protein